MATVTTILNFARAQVQTDSNGLTDANGLIFLNESLLDLHRQLISHGVDASQVQESYMDAVSGQGTYLYPSDLFFLKAIEVNLTTGNPQDYQTCNQIDVSNLPGGNSFSYLRLQGSPFNPQFDDRGDWFEVFPTPLTGMNLSQAFRIFYFLEPTEYVSTSDTVVYPNTLDYRTLGWRVAADYLYSLRDIPNGDKFMAKYTEHLTQFIDTLSRGVQTPNQATVLQISGWQY